MNFQRIKYLTIIAGFMAFFSSCLKQGNPMVVPDGVISFGTMTDQQGNEYKSVTIGKQTWMAQNLRASVYNDNTPITTVTDTTSWQNSNSGALCSYKNTSNSDTIKKFGLLYNWYTVKTNKICPAQWHVPTHSEWDTLLVYLAAHKYSYYGYGLGIAKALADTEGWKSNQYEGTVGFIQLRNNASGFQAVPSGNRNKNGKFDFAGSYTTWWSSTERSVDSAYARGLNYSESHISIGYDHEKSGFSIRCIKD